MVSENGGTPVSQVATASAASTASEAATSKTSASPSAQAVNPQANAIAQAARDVLNRDVAVGLGVGVSLGVIAFIVNVTFFDKDEEGGVEESELIIIIAS